MVGREERCPSPAAQKDEEREREVKIKTHLIIQLVKDHGENGVDDVLGHADLQIGVPHDGLPPVRGRDALPAPEARVRLAPRVVHCVEGKAEYGRPREPQPRVFE